MAFWFRPLFYFFSFCFFFLSVSFFLSFSFFSFLLFRSFFLSFFFLIYFFSFTFYRFLNSGNRSFFTASNRGQFVCFLFVRTDVPNCNRHVLLFCFFPLISSFDREKVKQKQKFLLYRQDRIIRCAGQIYSPA